MAWLGGGSGPYEPLGLEGKVVSVRRAIPKETVEEPWAYGQQRMFVLEEHREFLVAVVLSHLRPTFCFGPSHEYVTCLDKFDIKTGELVVKEAK
ncbi:MAG: hypothetical protein LUI02_02185 [Clostridiales bacterium]|nr:hypothetical protein [Clostridiales bacterium]